MATSPPHNPLLVNRIARENDRHVDSGQDDKCELFGRESETSGAWEREELDDR